MSEKNYFITPKGYRYHFYISCNYLKGRKFNKVSLIQAKRLTKGPCCSCQRLYEKSCGNINNYNNNKEEEEEDDEKEQNDFNNNIINLNLNNEINNINEENNIEKNKFDNVKSEKKRSNRNNKKIEEKKELDNNSSSSYSKSSDSLDKNKKNKNRENKAPFISNDISGIKPNTQFFENSKVDIEISKEGIENDLIINNYKENNNIKDYINNKKINKINNISISSDEIEEEEEDEKDENNNININNKRIENEKEDENDNNNINNNINENEYNYNNININNKVNEKEEANDNNNININNNIDENEKEEEKEVIIENNKNNNSIENMKKLKYFLNPNLPKKDLNWTSKDFIILKETNSSSSLIFFHDTSPIADPFDKNINILSKKTDKIDKGFFKFKFEITPYKELKEPMQISIGFEINYFEEENKLKKENTKMNLFYETISIIQNFVVYKKTNLVHVFINIPNGKLFVLGDDELKKRNNKIFLNSENTEIIFLKNFKGIQKEFIKDVRAIFKYNKNCLKLVNIDLLNNDKN